MTTRTRRVSWLIPLFALGLLAAACGDDGGTSTAEGTTGDETTGDTGGGAAGDVLVSGSSTVAPISGLVADNLGAVNPDILVTVNGPGTGDGFQLFCTGETDVSDASRPIDEEEIALCEENGVEYVELYIAIDGLSVLTSPENADVECLNFADLYALVGPESSDVENWSDATELASELGSSTEFPDARLDISAPGAESGTYDSFIELALGDIIEERGQEETTRNFPGQPDDSIIIQGIEGSPSSFGWVGYAFAEGAGDAVKEISIAEEPDGECIAPTAETIASGEYPLSRPLFIYVNADKAEENPALAEYIDFYLNDGIEAVETAGYVAIPSADLDETRARWEDRTTGAAAAE